MGLKERASELSKNQQAIAAFTKLAVGAIIFGVAAYSDIQFIMIMWKAFPDGIAKIFSLIGAVATGMSVLALVVAEAYWFSRGPQMVFGWLFTAMEVAVSVLNVILSFEMSGGAPLDPFMATWLAICPATPFVAFVGWIVVLNLDEGQKARHEEREMQDDLAESEREHKKAVHESRMKLKTRYLESTTTYLDQISSDPRVQQALEAGAWKFAADELRALTGLLLPPVQPAQSLPTGPVVSSSSPTQPNTPESTPPTTPNSNQQPAQPDMATMFAAFQSFMQQQQPAQSVSLVEPVTGPIGNNFYDDLAGSVATPDASQIAPADVDRWIDVYNRHPDKESMTFATFMREMAEAPFVVAPTGNHNGNGASQNSHN